MIAHRAGAWPARCDLRAGEIDINLLREQYDAAHSAGIRFILEKLRG